MPDSSRIYATPNKLYYKVLIMDKRHFELIPDEAQEFFEKARQALESTQLMRERTRLMREEAQLMREEARLMRE